MQETVSKLIELQKIDSRLLEIEEIKGDLPSIVKKTEDKVNMLQSDVTNNIDEININDKKTFELLSTGETTGIFQLESAGMKDTLKQLKPDKFEDIIAIVALYRPGPMANIPSYIERKHGREKPDYIHPLLEKLLELASSNVFPSL